MQTVVGVNDPKAVRRWAFDLAIDMAKQSYLKKFIGRTENSLIHEKIDLQSDAGDRVSFDLSMRLREKMTTGDDRIEGKEEGLKFYTDQVIIDQARKAASGGGRMSRKRTLHDLRSIAKARVSEYCAEWLDELLFVYLSGAVGANEDGLVDGEFAGNPIQAPDTAHLVYGGVATSKASLVATDKLTVDLIYKLNTRAKMMNAVDPDAIKMQPLKIDGEEHFVLLMSPFQVHDLKTQAGDRSWTEFQKAAAGATGRSNELFKGNLGKIDNTVLHEHSNVRRFSDYGAGANVKAARALFLGRQAGTAAFGGSSKSRMTWFEKLLDAGNEVAIYCGMICGAKKTRFNNRDFGMISVDTAATAPA